MTIIGGEKKTGRSFYHTVGSKTKGLEFRLSMVKASEGCLSGVKTRC